MASRYRSGVCRFRTSFTWAQKKTRLEQFTLFVFARRCNREWGIKKGDEEPSVAAGSLYRLPLFRPSQDTHTLGQWHFTGLTTAPQMFSACFFLVQYHSWEETKSCFFRAIEAQCEKIEELKGKKSIFRYLSMFVHGLRKNIPKSSVSGSDSLARAFLRGSKSWTPASYKSLPELKGYFKCRYAWFKTPTEKHKLKIMSVTRPNIS